MKGKTTEYGQLMTTIQRDSKKADANKCLIFLNI